MTKWVFLVSLWLCIYSLFDYYYGREIIITKNLMFALVAGSVWVLISWLLSTDKPKDDNNNAD